MGTVAPWHQPPLSVGGSGAGHGGFRAPMRGVRDGGTQVTLKGSVPGIKGDSVLSDPMDTGRMV